MQYTVVSLSGCSTNLAEQERVNALCRANGVAFYTADTCGFFGQIFSDLGDSHSFVRTNGRGSILEGKDVEKAWYPDFADAFHQANWGALNRDNRYGLPVSFFAMQCWQHYKQHVLVSKAAASENDSSDGFIAFAQGLLRDRNVQEGTLDEAILQRFVRCAPAGAENACAELAPVCAVLGGTLASDVIKAISGRDEAIRNFFTFDALQSDGIERFVASKYEVKSKRAC